MEYITKYFTNLSQIQLQQFEKMYSLYYDWNIKINLISRKDIENLYLKHVLHSLAIAKFIDFKDNTKIVDYGTGGGFPGIPLTIIFPSSNFLLVDSISKKIKVVDDVITSLGLENTSSLCSRVEDISGEYDFFVSRSVTKLDIAWNWVSNKISEDSFNNIENGLIALKGGDLSHQLPQNINFSERPISTWFNEEYFKHKMVIHIKKVEVPR